MKHRIFVLCLILVLAAASALAEIPLPETAPAVPTVSDVGLDLMGSSVHYPQVTGLADAAVQETVNAAILEAGHIEDRLSRMAMLISSPVKLEVSYRHALWGDVFSCAFLADGAVENSRATQVWSAVNIDLTTGEALSLDSLFTDAAAARAAIESCLEEQVAPDMSAHLAAGSLTPLPETFSVDEYGLTFYYPIEQFRTLSDRAGTVRLWWHELREHLAFDLPAGETDLALLLESEGGIPGIPAVLAEQGDPLQALIDRHGLLNDPDAYEGGQMIALEDDRFRGAWLLIAELASEDEFDSTPVLGIRADRGALGFLTIGETDRTAWRAVLGEPETTLAVDEARAESWRILPGTSDYYPLGGCRLRLHADEGGILRSIFITK